MDHENLKSVAHWGIAEMDYRSRCLGIKMNDKQLDILLTLVVAAMEVVVETKEEEPRQ